VSKRRFEELDNDNRIWWGDDGNNMPRQKRFLSEVKDGVVPQTLLPYKLVGHTQEAKKELLEFVDFDNTENVLNSVKPTRLLRHLVKIATKPDEEDLVLDFFSGSGPVGHAVFEQNKEDSGNRRFILVQLPEPLKTEETSASYISDLGKSRIRNVSRKLSADLEGQLDLGGRQDFDFGFKVLKLNQSNFKQWQAPAKDISDEALIQQMELNVDHIDPNASQEDLLYELLLKAGIMPTEKVEAIEVAGQPVYAVAERTLLVHLENTIDQALIDAVLDLAPQQFICLDKAFHGNDQLKANAVKTFANFNQSKEGLDRIEFKTV
jgi:adenine-specific DNA-methyltransferase